MTHRFPSLAQPAKLAYVYDIGHHTGGAISSHMRFYETYGDGMVQHSETAPISLGMLTDYLFSLAQAMQADTTLIESCGHELRAGVATNADIEFAFSVIYKEGKTRYYSREQRKVSASPAKRHDKRYEEITSYFDGSLDSAYRVLWRDFYNGIRAYSLMESILRYQNQVHHQYLGIAADHLKWNVDRERLASAWACATEVVEAEDRRALAARRLRNYQRELDERNAPPEAPAAQEVA